jgi:hypothetical protein
MLFPSMLFNIVFIPHDLCSELSLNYFDNYVDKMQVTLV